MQSTVQQNQHALWTKAEPTQQSRNRKLQVAGPRKYSAARNKDALFSVKAKRLNRLNDLQRSNYPLTDIKSIYAAFKVAITSFPTFYTHL